MRSKTLHRHLIRLSFAFTIALAALALNLSCGGGTTTETAGGGIGGTGITIGSVSEYGSIFVNGLEFDTSQADIFVEGEFIGTGDQAVRDYLPIGQLVVVRGHFFSDTHAVATRVDAHYRVRGPLQDIFDMDADTRFMLVLGQLVVANKATKWADDIPVYPEPGIMLQVSGAPDEQGVIHAGYISRPTTDGDMGVKGLPWGLDTVGQTFKINDLVIDYSQLQPQPDVTWPAGSPIAVKGVLDDTKTLVAVALGLFLNETFDSADEFSINGFIEASQVPGQWRMDDYEIRFSGDTLFEGLRLEDIAVGIRMQLRGQLQNRVLLVEQATAVPSVQLEEDIFSSRVQLEGNISSVSHEEQWLTLDGMPSLRIYFNAQTGIQGKDATLDGGDHIRVQAETRDSSSVTATKIFKSTAAPQADRFQLQGPVGVIADPEITILGVTIDTQAHTGIEFLDASDQPLSPSGFVQSLSAGMIIRIDGRWDNDMNMIIYEKMTIID